MHCNSCNEENVFHVYPWGDDEITFKFTKNDHGNNFIEIMIRDGDYNFQSMFMPFCEFDDFIRRILKVRKHMKAFLGKENG